MFTLREIKSNCRWVTSPKFRLNIGKQETRQRNYTTYCVVFNLSPLDSVYRPCGKAGRTQAHGELSPLNKPQKWEVKSTSVLLCLCP